MSRICPPFWPGNAKSLAKPAKYPLVSAVLALGGGILPPEIAIRKSENAIREPRIEVTEPMDRDT